MGQERGDDGVPFDGKAYAAQQLARACVQPEDLRVSTADNEARRTRKAEAWEATLVAMAAGTACVGSRQALGDATPVWVTPEVLHGGFASGLMLAKLPAIAAGERGVETWDTNEAWLSEAGVARLAELLDSGRYRVRVPEHGALLVVAWLQKNDLVDEAQELLNEIVPWFGVLRFWPDADESFAPLDASCTVSVSSAADAAARLRRAVASQKNPDANIEALTVLLPLKHELLSLFAETLEDGPESDSPESMGCGWPCQQYPDGWLERARALLDEVDRRNSTASEEFYRHWEEHETFAFNHTSGRYEAASFFSHRPSGELRWERPGVPFNRKGSFTELANALRCCV